MDLSIARSRHRIFNNSLPSHSIQPTLFTPASTLTSSTPIQSLLRQSQFQLFSIQTVLTRLNQYDTRISQLNSQFQIQLEGFNNLAEVQYDEGGILKQIIEYSRGIEEYQQVMVEYGMVGTACPHDTKDVGMRSDLSLGDIKAKLNSILLKQQTLRNTLLQNSLRQPLTNSLSSQTIPIEFQQLKHMLSSNRIFKTQLLLIIFKQHQKQHLANIQTLERHKNILAQLENVFESLKLMQINQKEIRDLIEFMGRHFIELHSKMDQPQQIQRAKREFKNILEEKQLELVQNKQRFYKNVSSSYIKGYTQQLDKFTVKHNQFQKAFEQYRVNSQMFDSIFQHKSKIQQKLNKKGKIPQDIQQIRNLYRSLLDLQTNQQLSYYKYHLVSQHSQTLQKLNISIQSFSHVDNYLLTTKIKQFQKIIESGLSYMSLNLSELQICKSQLQQILFTPNLKQQQQILCRDYIKQIQISFKLIELFDGVKKYNYKMVNDSLYEIEAPETLETLGRFVSNIMVKHLDNMGGYYMFQSLHHMFYEYVRDLIIINEIQNQYKVLKQIFHKKLSSAYLLINKEQQPQDNMIKSQQIQLIFPILKSIRSLSSLDLPLKTHLSQNLYKIYYNYIYTLTLHRNNSLQISPQQIVKKIQNNPQFFNSFYILSSSEYLRKQYVFYSKQFYKLLEKTIENVCSEWRQYSMKQKIIQLIKLYFYQRLMEESNIKKNIEYGRWRVILDYLVRYLNLDTEIRIISTIQQKITSKSPVFFQLIKLQHQKLNTKYNILSNNLLAVIHRFITHLQNSLPIKTTTGLNYQFLINQLKVTESGRDLKEICGFDRMIRVNKRALLYYYLWNVLNYRKGSLVDEGEVKVIVNGREGKYQVDLKGLEGEVGEVMREYEGWAGDMVRKMRGETVGDKNYPYQFQREMIQKL